MKYTENHKLIFSGNKIQIYTYSLPIISKKKVPTRRNLSFDERAENRKNYLKRSATAIDRIIWSNPDMQIFITLTFAENIIDTKRANYLFNQFVQKYNYHNQNNKLKYLAVIEFQKRGAVHYHVLVNRFIAKNDLENFWKNGLTRIEKIRGGPKQMKNYLVKYLNKNSYRDDRLWGKKMYFTSQNIIKPRAVNYESLLDVKDLIEWYVTHNNREIVKEHFDRYEAGFIGEIEYREIILKNKSNRKKEILTSFPPKMDINVVKDEK